jgi:signal transduction histidine kinase
MRYILDADPAKARESLEHIQRASEAVLEELRLAVGLLRQPGDREPVEPATGLARLEELIESFSATGLHVTCQVTGQVRPLPEATDLTAYRVIQESLTNTAKHAAGAAVSLRLAYQPGTLAIGVEDDGPPASAEPTAGHGIIGMRERAAALGGWLKAGPRDGGGFQVRAELPAPVPAGIAHDQSGPRQHLHACYEEGNAQLVMELRLLRRHYRDGLRRQSCARIAGLA